MPTIKSKGWTGNTTTWYFSFEYTISVKELKATVDWDLYVRTKDKVASTKFVYAEYDLKINNTSISKIGWYFSAKRDKYLDSGSFEVDLNASNGQGKFALQLNGSFYSSGSNNNSISNQDININGGWSQLNNCSIDWTKTKDEGNNIATIAFSLPNNNLANIVQGAELLWTTNGLTPTAGTAYTNIQKFTGNALSTHSISIPFNSQCEFINFSLIPIGSKNSITSPPLIASGFDVKYYGAPYFGETVETELVHKNQKPTIREKLTWRWSPANSFNSYSPVKGYVLNIFKDNQLLEGLTPQIVNNYWDFYAEQLDFQRQDNIYLGIKAFSQNGKGEYLYSSQIYTQDYTFGNNGIVRMKTNGNWEIGQVWLKDNDKWEIATTLFLKDEDNEWHIAI